MGIGEGSGGGLGRILPDFPRINQWVVQLGRSKRKEGH